MTTTYTPLVGDNLINSFTNVAAAAIAKTTGQGNGRPGRTKVAFTLENTDVSTANDIVLTLQIQSPIDFLTTVAGLADRSAYAPACNITLKSAATLAHTAVMFPRISAGPATVAGVVPVVITFLAGGGASAAAFNVEIDFLHSATN